MFFCAETILPHLELISEMGSGERSKSLQPGAVLYDLGTVLMTNVTMI